MFRLKKKEAYLKTTLSEWSRDTDIQSWSKEATE